MQIYNFSQLENDREYISLMVRDFGRNIRNLRHGRKLTQEELAELAGINPKYLGEIERGKKNPTAVVVYKLAVAMDVPICELLSSDACRYAKGGIVEEISRLMANRDEKEIQKAFKLLGVLFE